MKIHFRKFRRELRAEHGGKCFYCGDDLAFEGHNQAQGRDWIFPAVRTKMASEHMQPLVRGGAHERKNVVASCHRCNTIKGRRSLEEFRFYMAFRERRWPYRFFGEAAVPERDVLFVTSPEFMPALMVANFGKRSRYAVRGFDIADARRQPIS